MSGNDDQPPWINEDIPLPEDFDEAFGAVEVRARAATPEASRSGPTPPHSLEAEREVLAAALVDPDVLEDLSELRPAAFYFERHQILARCMLQLAEAGTAVDPVTLQQRLKDAGVYERVGGARAIGELLDRAGTCANIEHYCAIVKRMHAARAIIDCARDIEVAGLQGGHDNLAEFMTTAIDSLTTVIESHQPEPFVRLTDYGCDKAYRHEAAPVPWILHRGVARGDAHVVASPGDAGKGFMTLSAALQLSSGIHSGHRRAPFGKAIEYGIDPMTVVLLYAEDNAGALDRRFKALDPDRLMRDAAGPRLIAVPFPSVRRAGGNRGRRRSRAAGGAPTILQRNKHGEYVTTDRWSQVLDQLDRLPNLGMVVVDPLSCFVSLDIDKESSAAQAIMGEFVACAAEFNAAFVVTHHMRKGSGEAKVLRESVLPSHEEVRDNIRGAGALLNAVRMGYGFVPVPRKTAKAVLNKLGERGEVDSARVYWGAAVKGNDAVDRRPQLYVRHACGLLEDRTTDIAPMGNIDDAVKALVSKAS